MKKMLVVVALSTLFSVSARADLWVGGTVTTICADCFPEQGVVFAMSNTNNSTCPNGTWFYYNPPGASIEKLKAAYAAIMAAYLSQRTMGVNATAVPWAGACTINVLRPG